MSARTRILVVEDDQAMCSLLAKVLARDGYEVELVADGSSALELLRASAFDLVLTDLKMPDKDGLAVLRAAKQADPTTEVIMMTAFGSVDTAVSAMKQGAYDYISKPFPMGEILVLVQKALEKSGLRREVERLRREARGREGLEALLGRSPAMKRVFELVRAVAPSASTVLITGKSGTGKELAARAIHHLGPRKDRPFTVIHCGTIPDALMESELFGYDKGAFTGAVAQHKGLFEEADKGTLLLDEVNALTSATQVKLLRVLEDRRVRRLGGRGSLEVDIRVIAASNQDLAEEVRGGRFREDLYFRLNVLHVRLPDLKDRAEDIPLLAEHFLLQFYRENGRPPRRLSREALALIRSYSWPGNVRELKNMMEQAALVSTSDEIRPEDLPELRSEWQRQLSCRLATGGASLEEMERLYIQEVLRQTGGHRGRAACLLGIDRRTLYSKMLKYRIQSASDTALDGHLSPRLRGD
jgi:DNA-binding NtrC family response regulator